MPAIKHSSTCISKLVSNRRGRSTLRPNIEPLSRTGSFIHLLDPKGCSIAYATPVALILSLSSSTMTGSREGTPANDAVDDPLHDGPAITPTRFLTPSTAFTSTSEANTSAFVNVPSPKQSS